MSTAVEKLKELPLEEQEKVESYIDFVRSRFYRVPNEETRESLEDIRADRNVTTAESKDDFYKAEGKTFGFRI